MKRLSTLLLLLSSPALAKTSAIVGIALDQSSTVKPASQPLSTPAGETGQISITVTHPDGTPYDLTGAQLLLAVGSKISRQATIDNAAAGTAHFPLVIADTINMLGTYSYDVTLTATDGSFYRVVPASSFVVTAGIGQPGQAVTVPAAQQPLAQGPAGPQGPAGATGPAGPQGNPVAIADEGGALTQRSTLNFTGAGVTCTDNAGQSRTDCTIPGGGSSGNLTFTPAATSPIASGQTGIWSNSGDGQMYYQKADNTQAILTPACILSPAAQQTGNINVDGTVRGDSGIIGTLFTTLFGTTQMTLDDSTGFKLQQTNLVNNSFAKIACSTATGVSQSTCQIETVSPNSSLAVALYVANYIAINAAGWAQIGFGSTFLNVYNGSSTTDTCMIAEDITSSSAINAGDVVVWTGSKQVGQSAASAGLKTAAGVALTGTSGAGQSTRVCRIGRALANSETGVVAGDILTTSGTNAGKVVTNNTPAAGAKVGRAIEAVGGTVAGKVTIDVEL